MATSAQKNVINKSKDVMNDYQNKSNSSLSQYNAAYNAYKNAVNTGYRPSSAVNNYRNERDNALKKAQAMGDFSYESQYKDKIEGLLNNAENMKFNFNYSLTDDPAYQTYRDQYVHNGQMAAQNAAAEAAAQTGGYGSTAATAASQQAYNESLTQLNQIVPDLYNAAYNRQWNEFTNERDTLQELASAYQSLDQQGYDQALATWTNNFNQYITLAQQYNSNYQYLDSAERAQYETKLDGLYNMLTSSQQQYATNVGAYLDAMGTWAGAVSDAANYDLNSAQLAETKRYNQATEAAAKAQLNQSRKKSKDDLIESGDMMTEGQFIAAKSPQRGVEKAFGGDFSALINAQRVAQNYKNYDEYTKAVMNYYNN